MRSNTTTILSQILYGKCSTPSRPAPSRCGFTVRSPAPPRSRRPGPNSAKLPVINAPSKFPELYPPIFHLPLLCNTRSQVYWRAGAGVQSCAHTRTHAKKERHVAASVHTAPAADGKSGVNGSRRCLLRACLRLFSTVFPDSSIFCLLCVGPFTAHSVSDRMLRTTCHDVSSPFLTVTPGSL